MTDLPRENVCGRDVAIDKADQMSRYDDARGSGRRGFDDDGPSNYGSRPSRPGGGFGQPRGGTSAPVPSGPPVDAVVKWFKSDKGFGFVELSNGSGDAFLHVGALQSAGYESVEPGTKLTVQVGAGAKGTQVTQVLDVDTSGAQERAPQQRSYDNSRGTRRGPDPSTALSMSGTVKWFNDTKGFGFVASSDGGKDVFVHISVVERAGLSHLAEGQAVNMQVVDTPKGREALSIALG